MSSPACPPPRQRGAALVLALLLVPLLPTAAQAAGSVSSDGRTIHVVEAVPGEVNAITVATQEVGVVEISDYGTVVAGAGCEPKAIEPATAVCPLGDGGIEVETGGGNDNVGSYIGSGLPPFADGALRVSLGDGDDRFSGGVMAEAVDGGAGNDTLEGRAGNDTLDGGSGDDKLDGQVGADLLRGGDGNDLIKADAFSDDGIFGDTIDGGAGFDELEDYKHAGGEASAPAISVTLDGSANDGRAGEGDNVLGIERISSSSAGSFVGDEDPNQFVAPEVGGAGNYAGRGGNDSLLAGDASGDVLDGGVGDDDLSGGYGDDTLTGGPGRDTIAGDRPARCNEIHCDIGGGFGNDVIEARDGEIDSISCGPGTDRVRADANDVVAADCEQVDRAQPGGSGPGPGGAGTPSSSKGRKATLRLSGKPRLRKALKAGLTVRVAGARAGKAVRVSLVVSGKLARKLGLARKARAVTVASGRAKVKAGGVASVRVTFTRAARKRLARASGVSLSLRAAGATTRTISLRR